MSMADGITDVMQYVISGAGTYMGFAVLFWAAGLILTKLNGRETEEPAVSEGEGISMEELEEKTMAREAELSRESESAEDGEETSDEEQQQALEEEETEQQDSKRE